MSNIPSIDQKEILQDYRLACESRAASLLARKEVFSGKAKFGIFGDGKEVAQLAMAKYCMAGDWRSGYYRDQTFMLATGTLTLQQYFAQLYGHSSIQAEPASGGRMMNCHFATRFIDQTGHWCNQLEGCNVAADLSPTAAQMPKLLGLAYASKLYRSTSFQRMQANFSLQGNEVAFGTIGDASTSEGMFFEAVNAAGLLQVPLCLSIWDDGYGISVPTQYQTTKGSISTILAGFQRSHTQPGYEIFTVKGWDYPSLCQTYQQAVTSCRTSHIPVIIHVQELTQPQGHSTSGSHERYKSKERLSWEAEYDCLKQMAIWVIDQQLATPEQLADIQSSATQKVKQAQQEAWDALVQDQQQTQQRVLNQLKAIHLPSGEAEQIRLDEIIHHLSQLPHAPYFVSHQALSQALYLLRHLPYIHKKQMLTFWRKSQKIEAHKISSHLYSQSQAAAQYMRSTPPIYDQDPIWVDGKEILSTYFKGLFQRNGRIFAIGQDLGKIGDVNQGFAGIQALYGPLRATDTGIRECTMVGQAIGCAMRGLRPIVEIQYLDYLPYALQIISDDLATLHHRTRGGQKAPVIIRTRGHRLEGMWHSGSYMASILHAIRGIYLLVPRNMTQAIGFYNTMVASDDPAILVECLNGYRTKEPMAKNLDQIQIPLGVPEILRPGDQVTIVTYGAMCKIVLKSADELSKMSIECEVIDVQTLLPFDLNHTILTSLKKTGMILFADEDLPGGTTAYMMQEVLEVQKGYPFLKQAPVTLTSQPHRPVYGDDGNYFSKPNVEDVIQAIYQLMHQDNPVTYPLVF